MSHQEFLVWAAYCRKNGALSINKKLEWSFALIAMLLTEGKKPMSDFMPYMKEPEEEISLDKAMKDWR
ncbi:MAG: hypothetical protein V4628_11455 [Pseudomonadota bacterium]